MRCKVIVEAYKKKKLPRSFTQAHGVLIQKTDDTTKLQSVASYRPISISNTDYKIFMKVSIRGMQTVIEKIVPGMSH